MFRDILLLSFLSSLHTSAADASCLKEGSKFSPFPPKLNKRKKNLNSASMLLFFCFPFHFIKSAVFISWNWPAIKGYFSKVKYFDSNWSWKDWPHEIGNVKWNNKAWLIPNWTWDLGYPTLQWYSYTNKPHLQLFYRLVVTVFAISWRRVLCV